MVDPTGTVDKTIERKSTVISRARYSVYSSKEVEKVWAKENKGVITTAKNFEKYPWPEPEREDFSVYEEVKKYLPQGMKVIAVVGKVFTATWMLMGFNTFCYILTENPKLVEAIFNRIGEIQLEVFKKVVEFDSIGAIWAVDDIAYGTGLIVSPEILRNYIFPWYKKMGDICKEKGLPFIYHSDGNLWEVMDDLIDIGFNALHPIEPMAMDIKELKEKVGGKLCLLGNIDLDRLSRGTPKEIKDMVRENIKNIAPGGGYCIGSSNSVTNYVPLKNYKALLEATFEYGRYPLDL